MESVSKIAAEGSHVCVLETDGTITCAGINTFGQLGNGEFSETLDFAFTNVPDIDDATDISLGYDHTCALHESGEISCWGRNHFGQLGNGEENVGRHSAVPQRVVGISDAIAVEAGALTTTCALHENGEISCWGQSDQGELGTNADLSNDHSAVPVEDRRHHRRCGCRSRSLSCLRSARIRRSLVLGVRLPRTARHRRRHHRRLQRSTSEGIRRLRCHRRFSRFLPHLRIAPDPAKSPAGARTSTDS